MEDLQLLGSVLESLSDRWWALQWLEAVWVLELEAVWVKKSSEKAWVESSERAWVES